MASFLTLRGDSLSDAQRRTLVKLACAIAWADGALVEGEHHEIAKSLEELGGIDRAEFERMLLHVKLLDPALKEELRNLPQVEANQVLKLAFRIASADGRVDDKELAIIREACSVIFPDKPWDLVLDWFRSHQTMTGLVDLAPGASFAGEFRVVKRLSEGGMGAVYVVEQVATGALRALKLMHPQLVADPKQRKRFEQEARVGARIESEHVVQVVAAGVDAESGAPWLAMELLSGEDLAEYTERVGCLPAGEVREVFEQLCHAVGAAHAAGIVHRDLKPANVFLARAKRVGAPYVIKVLDFGIAKVASEAKTADTAAMGTPLWMAPEQTARGQSISPATDVWALGLIAFRLLTGKVFWQSANDEQASSMMLLREIALEEIPNARDRAAEFGCAERLVPGFDAWFAKCVTRKPEDRFADATLAYAALDPLLPHDPTTASRGLAEAAGRSAPKTASQRTAFDSTRPAALESPVGASTTGAAALPHLTAPDDTVARRAPKGSRRGMLFALAGVGVVGAGALALGRFRAPSRSVQGAPAATASVPVIPSVSAAPVQPVVRRTNVLKAVKGRGVLRVGVEKEAPPLNDDVVEGAGSWTGIDFEVIRAVATAMGIGKLEVHHASFKMLPDLLRDDKVDVIMGGQAADGTNKALAWSEPYLDYGLCLIVRKGSAIKHAKTDLKGQRVGVYAGDAKSRETVLELGVDAKMIEEGEGTGWLKVLVDKRVDAVVFDYPFAIDDLGKPGFEGLRIVELNLTEWQYVIGMPDDNADLVDAINAGLDTAFGKARDTKAYAEMVQKHLRKNEKLFEASLPAGSDLYLVREGDTLQKIANARLGDGKRAEELWRLNKSRFGNKLFIHAGDRLILPAK